MTSKLDLWTNDIEQHQADLIIYLQNQINEVLWPGDERRLFAEALMSYLVSWQANANDQALQTYLRFARGAHLDAIGETRWEKRLPPDFAKTTLKFSLKVPKPFNVSIPRGTRASNDGQRFFATDKTAVIEAGQTEVIVEATATVAGSEYNDIKAGEIKIINDKVANVESVVNLVDTYNGQDIEDDDHYRERIRLAPNKRSTAGPAQAYRAYALDAHPDIADALVLQDTETFKKQLPVYGGFSFFPTLNIVSLDTGGRRYDLENENFKIEALGEESFINCVFERHLAGRVVIVPICKGGVIPSADILNQVLETCSDPRIRPLTDHVEVRPPDPVYYDIEAIVYTTKDKESVVKDAIEGTEDEPGAVARYIQWQDETLNNDLNPDYLRKLMLCPHWTIDQTGADRVEIIKPEYTELLQTEIPKCTGNIKVSYQVKYG